VGWEKPYECQILQGFAEKADTKGVGRQIRSGFFVRKEQPGPRGKSYSLDLPKRFFSIFLGKLGTGC
jgi:hypothetical protein